MMKYVAFASIIVLSWSVLAAITVNVLAIQPESVQHECGKGEVYDNFVRHCISCDICKEFPATPICRNCTKELRKPVPHERNRFSVGSEQKLFEDLFEGYNKRVRPVKNFTHAVNVLFNVRVTQIADVDERNQVLKTNAWTYQEWTDETLVWDPADYDGLSEIRVPATEVWLPDITLYNNADSHDYVADNTSSSNAIVSYEGRVILKSKPTLLKSTCKIYVKYFPFDAQACKLKFGSWTFSGLQINLLNHSSKPNLDDYILNEQWQLVRAQTERHVKEYDCCPETYIDVTFFLCLSRKPMYYIYNLIIPCLLLCALALTGFFMPYSVGVVKASISVTLILSLTVFLLLVAEMMPRTSEEIPLIGQYYLATMCLISLSTAMNVAVLNVHGCRREVPQWIRLIVLRYLAAFVCMGKCCSEPGALYRAMGKEKTDQNNCKNSSILHLRDNSLHGLKNDSRHTMSSYQELTLDDFGQSKFGKIEHHVEQIFRHLKTVQRRMDKKSNIREQWACVAAVLDKALMYLFFLATVVTTLYLLLQDPGDPDELCLQSIANGVL